MEKVVIVDVKMMDVVVSAVIAQLSYKEAGSDTNFSWVPSEIFKGEAQVLFNNDSTFGEDFAAEIADNKTSFKSFSEIMQDLKTFMGDNCTLYGLLNKDYFLLAFEDTCDYITLQDLAKDREPTSKDYDDFYDIVANYKQIDKGETAIERLGNIEKILPEQLS